MRYFVMLVALLFAVPVQAQMKFQASPIDKEQNHRIDNLESDVELLKENAERNHSATEQILDRLESMEQSTQIQPQKTTAEVLRRMYALEKRLDTSSKSSSKTSIDPWDVPSKPSKTGTVKESTEPARGPTYIPGEQKVIDGVVHECTKVEFVDGRYRYHFQPLSSMLAESMMQKSYSQPAMMQKSYVSSRSYSQPAMMQKSYSQPVMRARPVRRLFSGLFGGRTSMTGCASGACRF